MLFAIQKRGHLASQAVQAFSSFDVTAVLPLHLQELQGFLIDPGRSDPIVDIVDPSTLRFESDLQGGPLENLVSTQEVVLDHLIFSGFEQEDPE